MSQIPMKVHSGQTRYQRGFHPAQRGVQWSAFRGSAYSQDRVIKLEDISLRDDISAVLVS